jgi:hypothetical protein
VSLKLTPHFALDEPGMVSSDTTPATVPTSAVIALAHLADNVLEPVRALMGCPLHIDSGYRTVAHNAAIGGSPNSQHLCGQAADVRPLDADGVFSAEEFRRIATSDVPFDQCILYASGFVHLSHVADGSRPNRREVLTSEARGGSGGPYHPWKP